MDESSSTNQYYIPFSKKTSRRIKTELENSLKKNNYSESLTLPNISSFQSNYSSKREITLPTMNSPKDIQNNLAERKQLLRYISSTILDNLTQNFKNTLVVQQRQGNLLDQINKKMKAKPVKSHCRRQLESDFNIEEESIPEPNEKSSIILPPLAQKSLYVFWIDVDQTLWRPAVREGCAMTLCNKEVYMYGGLGLELYGDLMKLDLNTLKWTFEPLSFMSLTEEPKQRYGHTLNASRNILYVYGGETQTRASKEKFLCPDIHKFDIEQQTWKILKSHGVILEPRRSHAADFLGRNLIIVGGIGKRGKFLNDIAVFNTKTFRCSYMSIEENANPFLDGIAYHCMCSIFRTDKSEINLYHSINSESDDEEESLVRKAGIYIYGGLNQQNIPYDQMYVIDIQTYPCKISKLNAKGIRPPPLCMHAMIHNEKSQFLIIHGGKTELASTIFNQNIFVLSLKYLVWIKVNQKGNNPSAERAGHSAVSYDSRIIIFGGFNLSGYASSSLALLEIDKQVVQDSEVKPKIIFRQRSMEKKLKGETKSLSNADLTIQRKEKIQELSQRSIKLKESMLMSSGFKKSQISFKQSSGSGSDQLKQLLSKKKEN